MSGLFVLFMLRQNEISCRHFLDEFSYFELDSIPAFTFGTKRPLPAGIVSKKSRQSSKWFIFESSKSCNEFWAN